MNKASIADYLDGRLIDCTDELLSDVDGRRWPKPIDLRAMMAKTPTPPRMIIDDWLPCGYATLLAGHGGAGKSSIALHLATCIATGRPWWGMHVTSRRVLYLSCEDRADVLHWRLSRICELEELTGDDLGRLRIVDLVGHESILYRRDPQTGSGVTAAYGELERLVDPGDVIFVDGVSDTFGSSENDRAEVKSYVNALVRLVGTEGAVVLIHHVNKLSASNGGTSEGYSGSTGWHNSVRARWYLYPETEQTDDGRHATGDLILALQKSNLGRDDQAMRFRWDNDARMFVAERATSSREDREARDDAELVGIVNAIDEVTARGDYVPAAMQGPRTAWHVLCATESLPKSLKTRAARKRFWRHIETLRRNRIVREGQMRRANRHVVVTLEHVGHDT